MSRAAASEYPAAHRAAEIAAIVAAGALTLYLATRLANGAGARAWIVGAALVAGYVAADAISGLVHWIFDTFGSAETPVVGRSFIRPFREHHDDPLSITRHDFIETNGNSCIACVPLLGAACFIPVDSHLGAFASAFSLFTSLGVVATNQFHKWAHIADPGAVVRRLQRWRLILPREHHAVHHTAPYTSHYCITTGWANVVIDRIARRSGSIGSGLRGDEQLIGTAKTKGQGNSNSSR